MRTPLNNRDQYVQLHLDLEIKLLDYITAPSQRNIDWNWLKHQIDRRNSYAMYSNNFHSRIRFLDLCIKHTLPALSCSSDERICFVTFSNLSHAYPLSNASNVNLRALQAWVREIVRGHNFVGMTEAAFFRKGLPESPLEPSVSWHSHMLIWTSQFELLKEQIADVNARYRSMITGVLPGHCLPVDLSKVKAKMCYMMKVPRDEISIYSEKADFADPLTGEIFKASTGRVKRGKGALRRGNYVKMCRVMEDHWLDQLLFGGGEGQKVVLAIRHEALAEFRRREGLRTAA